MKYSLDWSLPRLSRPALLDVTAIYRNTDPKFWSVRSARYLSYAPTVVCLFNYSRNLNMCLRIVDGQGVTTMVEYKALVITYPMAVWYLV